MENSDLRPGPVLIKMKFILTALVCLISAFSFFPSLYAQDSLKEFFIRGIYQHNFISAFNGKPYRITIALPFGYSSLDTTKYPTLYLLDGDPNLPLAALIQRNMTYDHEVPNIILVGIGYQVEDFLTSRPYRTLDYTPTRDLRIDSIMTANHHMVMVSGGSQKFLQVLKEEIIPFINRNYKTNTDRGIAGHSFGGLFTVYTLFQAPELFNRYLISSPSLDWDNDEVFREEARFFNLGNRALSARIFICAGSLEPDPMIPDIEKLVGILKKRNYKGVDISEQVFDNETHLSVMPFAISKGLRAIYRGLDGQ